MHRKMFAALGVLSAIPIPNPASGKVPQGDHLILHLDGELVRASEYKPVNMRQNPPCPTLAQQDLSYDHRLIKFIQLTDLLLTP